MIITDKLIKDFTAEAKLKLHKEADNKYYECSGKSLPTIQSRIMKYNKGRDIKAFVVNDTIKDVSIISFRPTIV